MTDLPNKRWMLQRIVSKEEWRTPVPGVYTCTEQAVLARVELFKKAHGLKQADKSYTRALHELYGDCPKQEYNAEYDNNWLQVFQYPVSRVLVVCVFTYSSEDHVEYVRALRIAGIKFHGSWLTYMGSLWYPYYMYRCRIEQSEFASYLARKRR